MGISFVSKLQASERVKPSNRALHDPARFAKSTAVRRADFGKHGRDAALAQAFSVWLGTVAPVALDDFRLTQRASALSANRGNRLDQGVKLRDVAMRKR